ncbi:hypothetical protein DMB66_48320 [Actinoplanes sp. ATCC 53533]|uniref:helix-turn-helix transcriptional regulator n=1 Tax=Actinoplanes sp. ATCC 53533 TaxID=1288362 RepID=UPI000F7ACAFE|nr:AAA family ATPase [Actinoplanes sp. ATCC 53533]RSM47553.1 hypothetical protein DMB66_48320 [Actinoplanes sp. ATCC 53533]
MRYADPASPFVGRETEFARIAGLLGPTPAGPAQVGPAQDGPVQVGPAQDGPAQDGPAQDGPAQDGPAQVVEIVGDPGIGKTRLLAEVAAHARRSGWSVLSGRAAEFERQVPFGILGDALSEHLGAVAPAALGVPDLDLLRAVFPALSGAVPDRVEPGPVGAERFRLYRAVRSLLTALAGTGGLVLILDDLHWADEGSAELTEFLLRHRPAGRVLIVVAHRPRQTPAALRRALSRPEVEVIDLGPLSEADADGLLPATVDRRRRQRLHAASAGNPFYLLALAAQPEPGSPGPGGLPATTGAVPESVRAALAGEFAALTARQLLVAQGAAVAGDGVRAGLIARTTGLALDAVLADLDDLARHDLIRVGPGGRFRYRHPLVRRVGYDLAGAGWRVAAHARAAAALRADGASAAEIAVHIEHSAEPGDPAAVEVLRDAATAAIQHSPAAAAHWLTVALRLVPDVAESILIRLDLLTLRARAYGLSGRLLESRTTLHEIRRLLPAGLAEQHADIAAFCATIERLIGRHAEARAQLLAELRTQPDQHSDAALALKLGLATGVVIRADLDPGPAPGVPPDAAPGLAPELAPDSAPDPAPGPTPELVPDLAPGHAADLAPGPAPGPRPDPGLASGRDWPAEALTTARLRGDAVATAWALAMCVVADHMAGRVAEQTATRLAEAAQLVDALPDGDLAESIESIMWLGAAETCQEWLGDAIRHLLRALAITRAAGQGHGVAYIHAMLGAAHLLLGDLERAGAFLDDQLDAAYLTGSTDLVSQAWRNQCWIALARGDVEEALRAGKEAVACADAEKHGVGGLAEGTLGLAHLLSGDPATCIDLMVSGGGGPGLRRVDPFERSTWYEALAAAEAALGHTDEAAGWADRAFANAAGLPRRTGLAHVARAHSLRATDGGAAAESALRGAELLRDAGDRIMAGLAHLLAGQILAAPELAAPDRAREQFAAACALFEACGATGHLKRAVRERRRMDARRPRRAAGAALTPRERQVAELTAQGLTNRQIGDALFLSPNTVTIHLAHVFAKLGVSRRAAVAAHLRET